MLLAIHKKLNSPEEFLQSCAVVIERRLQRLDRRYQRRQRLLDGDGSLQVKLGRSLLSGAE